MNRKGSLVLMELLVMVLVFSLAAAGCLRCFLWADQTCRETALQDQALILARNSAEALKACGADAEAAEALLAVPQGLKRTICLLPAEIPGLAEAEITIETAAGEEILSLLIAWQEDS